MSTYFIRVLIYMCVLLGTVSMAADMEYRINGFEMVVLLISSFLISYYIPTLYKKEQTK